MDEAVLHAAIEKAALTDIPALLRAKESAKSRMMEEPTGANVTGYERAALLLEQAIRRQKESAAGAASGGAARFKKLSDVLKWLHGEGYKVKKSKVYQDAKAGYMVASEDGSFSNEAVLAYVHTQSLEKVAGRSGPGNLDMLSEKRLEKEVEKLTIQVEKLSWDMDRDQGKYLLKEDSRTELALKISAFEAGFKHMAQTRATDWVSAVSGVQEKQRVLVDMVFDAIDSLLEEFASIEELELVVVDNTREGGS